MNSLNTFLFSLSLRRIDLVWFLPYSDANCINTGCFILSFIWDKIKSNLAPTINKLWSMLYCCCCCCYCFIVSYLYLIHNASFRIIYYYLFHDVIAVWYSRLNLKICLPYRQLIGFPCKWSVSKGFYKCVQPYICTPWKQEVLSGINSSCVSVTHTNWMKL